MNIYELDIVHQNFLPGCFRFWIKLTSRGKFKQSRKKVYICCITIYCSRGINYGLSSIPHVKDLAMKICNGLRPKIPFHIPKLITTIMRWENKDSEIGIQIKKAEEISANQKSTNTTTTTLNYQTHPQIVEFLIFQIFQNPSTKN
ncbi:hypothetical protein Glove_136g56 [Diversispora epigaea]|uniref:Uncharacterized protein n=1 Tax=Diversispora epigaea TaxID=1348612 RepID=A0A397IZ83_9GLOM|nr:hypothetical protein Glove_136g56 [Diversispora epigaea]